MRLAFTAAIDSLARTVAAETTASSSDWPRIVRNAIRSLTPAQRLEIASANEMTFQHALGRAVQRIGTTV